MPVVVTVLMIVVIVPRLRSAYRAGRRPPA